MATWKFKEKETFDHEVDFLLAGFCVVLILLMLQAVLRAKKRDTAARLEWHRNSFHIPFQHPLQPVIFSWCFSLGRGEKDVF